LHRLEAPFQLRQFVDTQFGELVLDQPRIYRASGYWRTNVSGAILGGIGTAILLLTVFTIVLWGSDFGREAVIWFIGICLTLLGTALVFYPGNLVVTYPLAVEVDPFKQIVLIAPWKRLIIPIEDLRDIRNSPLQQGYVVRLFRRHGLLKSFTIHWFFGSERTALAAAIENIVSRNARNS
jgi:hypothetical protein